jgi:hypothetical protein
MNRDGQWVFILLASVALFFLARAEIAHFSIWPLVPGAALLYVLASVLFPSETSKMSLQTFGDVGYVRISSPAIEERIQNRYRSDVEELSALGFDFQFSVGQTFPVASLVLIYPAIVLLMMCWKREIITLNHGMTLAVVHAIYASKDKTTFARPSALGIVFHTVFEYGSSLVSTNYGTNRESNDPSGLKFQRRAYKGASIADTWAAHHRMVQAKIADGTDVDRDMSFKAYVAINS